MPSFIVKPIATDDFYVVWSTVVDAPTGWGSKSELMQQLGSDEGAPERFQRADERGTSMKDPTLPLDRQWFGWHEDAFMLREWAIPNARHGEGIYSIPRANLRALCEGAGDPTSLLIFTPHEDG